MIAKIVCESEKKITLVPTGPLTNIAVFILAYPNYLGRLNEYHLWVVRYLRGTGLQRLSLICGRIQRQLRLCLICIPIVIMVLTIPLIKHCLYRGCGQTKRAWRKSFNICCRALRFSSNFINIKISMEHRFMMPVL